MNDRITTLRNKMAGMNLQGMIIVNPINVMYLTGIDAEGVLLLTRKENIYITDKRYLEYVNSVLTPFDEIVVDDVKNIDKDEYENFFMFCENVGFEENYLTYAKYKEYMSKYKVNLVEAENLIAQIRCLKDDKEIKNIKEACKITDQCFEMLLKYIKPGMTEKQIARRIDRFYNDNSDGVSFDTIVASGENTSKPHAKPTDRVIGKKDIITIDMGCKFNGYCSDMTRTFFIGEPTSEQRKIYNLVLKNQKMVLDELRDGVNLKTIIQALESDFKLNGYELIHGLGHGVGLEVHEIPYFRNSKDFYLKEKMVVTDEPGIYLQGNFGVRIEDTVLVTKQGVEVLTESTKECIII